MIRRFLFLLFLSLTSFTYTHGQMVDPIKWESKIVQKGNTAELIFTATLDPEWHIYSQDYTKWDPTGNDGPLPTVFNFSKMKDYSLVGAVKEPSNGHEDPMWASQGLKNVICFDGKVVFKQKIKILTTKKFTLKVSVSYMVCKESCAPGDKDFEFVINPDSKETSTTVEEPVKDTSTAVNTEVIDTTQGTGFKPISFRFVPKKYSETEYVLIIRAIIEEGWYMSTKNDAKYPLKFSFDLPKGVELKGDFVYPIAKDSSALWSKAYSKVADFEQRFYVPSGDTNLMKAIIVKPKFAANKDGKIYIPKDAELNQSIDMSGAVLEIDPHMDKSYIWIFIGAFLSGFIALVMPCIFPMIPMTVSFFLKQSKTRKQGIRNAVMYGTSIVVIYVVLGLLITAIFGSDSLNELSTSVTFNLFFFFMLILFALSFLGAFEIRLPSSWVNAADKRADRGGLIGIFFMAFTLALVSFSCTGPIVGDLLVIAAKEGGWGPFWGMFGFSLAIALPFTLFAIFPSWLNSMPQSGGWLNTVKVSLGFLEFALAFKFLSNADLVVQGHLLERETFIAIWIAVFALWGFYLMGKFKLSHDSDVHYLSTGRLTTAMLVFSFVIYLIPGMWGAPVKWIAGFPPPQHYSESPYGILGKAPAEKAKKQIKLPADAKPVGVCNVMVCHNYESALEYAASINKPLLIDFTGYACVNCRKMEETVWCEPKVVDILKDSVVVVSLIVDDKKKMPESEHYVSKYDGKKKTTYGGKWSDFQKSVFGSNAQPQYFIVDKYGTVMNGSANYQDHGSEKLFNKWLLDGLKQYALFNGSVELKPELVEVK